MESTEMKDPKTGKVIAVSTTVRILYRKMFPTHYEHLRNPRLNAAIAKHFAQSGDNVLHYFKLGTGDESGTGHRGTAEIRMGPSGVYYISAIRENSVDILTVQSKWLKPKYKGSASEPLEMSDSGEML